MANYSDIRGYRVKYLSSDPTLNTSTEGQVWYNSTSGTLKSLVQIKAWSSGGNMTNPRFYPGGVGAQDTMLAITGQQATAMTTATEEYSGYTWSSGGAVGTARRGVFSLGNPTAAVIAGGDFAGSPGGPTSTATEEYNGSAWTAGNAIVSQGSFGASAGTLTAGLAFGGYNTGQTASSTVTVSYDGTSWTALPSPGSDTNTARNFTMGGGGTQTAAIFSGGSPAPNGNLTESWDGSTWTALNTMNTGRNGQGFIGVQTAGIYGGGDAPPRTSETEEWDGSTWSISTATLSSARNGSALSKGGSLNAATIAGGYDGTSFFNATEEYNSNINAITQSAWASGGAIPVAKQRMGAVGTQTDTLVYGGNTATGPVATSQTYDGSSWASAPSLSTGRQGLGKAGTTSAALGFGGATTSPVSTSYTNVTEEYNGSAWTSGGNLNVTRLNSNMGFGTLTAGVAAGGFNATSPQSAVEHYNGSVWTAATALPSAYHSQGQTGTQIAGLVAGGNPYTSNTFEYNGSAWTAGGSLVLGVENMSAFGTQGAAVVSSGNAGASPLNYTEFTQLYDGTGWKTGANVATGTVTHGGTGTSDSGLKISGETEPSGTTSVEEWSGEIQTATASTLTTS